MSCRANLVLISSFLSCFLWLVDIAERLDGAALDCVTGDRWMTTMAGGEDPLGGSMSEDSD